MADLMPDGKRFIAVLPAEADKSDRNTHLTFLLNLADDLNRRASDREQNAASSQRNGGPWVAGARSGAWPNFARHSAARASATPSSLPFCNKRFARDVRLSR